jgi:Na+/H+ antiporter NhaD/arsenite permease-like protein
MWVFSHQAIALLIFVVTYLILATEFRERTIAAMAGAGAVWAFGILSSEEALSYVDLRAIGLLFGMMVIVGALREARFFQLVGRYVSEICRGRPTYLLVAFIVITAALSAFLDNVTTIIFMVAITIDLTELVKFDPKPYVLSEIIASNIGGVGTLIGDPPNIMIAAATGFSFGEFAKNVGVVSIISLLVALLYLRKRFAREIGTEKLSLRGLPAIIPERRLLWTGIAALLGAVTLFVLQDIIGTHPSTVALAAATLLLFVGGPKMPEILKEVEWSTLIFFGSLFIVVGALEKTGWMQLLSHWILLTIGDNRLLGITVVLWISSMGSAFIDNIPFAAAFIPVLTDLGRSGLNVYPLWWALSAGTGLGGNGTLIGASANVIAAGIAQARGVKISFAEFFKVGMITLLITTAVSNMILLVMFVQ